MEKYRVTVLILYSIIYPSGAFCLLGEPFLLCGRILTIQHQLQTQLLISCNNSTTMMPKSLYFHYIFVVHAGESDYGFPKIQWISEDAMYNGL